MGSRILKGFIKGLFGVIGLLTLFLIANSCTIPNSLTGEGNSLNKRIVSALSIAMEQRSTSLKEYIDLADSQKAFGLDYALQNVVHAFTINQYAYSKEIEDETIAVTNINLKPLGERLFQANNPVTDKNTVNANAEVSFIPFDSYVEEESETKSSAISIDAMSKIESNLAIIKQLKTEQSRDFLLSKFYIFDPNTSIDETVFSVPKLLEKDMTIKKKEEPQILIYHTHASETYIDSRNGEQEDTVVGAGKILADLLANQYGYQVIHDVSVYDQPVREQAYAKSLPYIQQILKDNPSIEVVIDLHRDGGPKRVTTINGKECAQIMLFNGISRNSSGPIDYLPNKNLSSNLAFSLQVKMKGMEYYDNLFIKNYIKYYRFNMHLMPKYLLIELGTDKNTVQQAKNSMEPLAFTIDQVLSGKN